MKKMSDDELRAEHEKRLAVLVAARSAGDGDALYAARLAAGETQVLVNDRFGAPPAQSLGT